MGKNYFSAYAGLKKEIYILAAAKLVNCMGSFIFPLLTLILTQKLSMTGAEAGRLIAILTITQAPALALGGKLADALGKKKMFLIGTLLGSFLYLVCAFGPEGNSMIFFLILAADCIALSIPAQDSMLADVAPESQRDSAFSLLYFALNIGMAISPIIGGLLFLNHLRLLFLLDASTTIVCAAIIALKIKEKAPGHRAGKKREKQDDRRMAENPDHQTETVNRNETARKETARKEPTISLYAALKMVPALAVFLLLMFFFNFAYGQWSFLLPIQFGSIYGDSGARFYSYLSSANAITVILFTPMVTNMERNTRALTAIGISGLMYTAAYIGFGMQGPFWFFFLMGELFTFAEICATIRIGPFVYHYAPVECRGRIAAAENFIRGAAGALGPLIMGGLITATGYRAGWFVTAGCVFAGSMGMFLLNRSMKKHRQA